MKFSCEKAILQSAVLIAGRVVATKSTISALEGILVEASTEGLRLSGYNLETGIITRVDAQVTQPGSLILSARLFGEIIRKLPDDMITVSTEENSVHIACGPTSFDIMGSPADEFPELPAVDDGSSVTLTQSALRSMLSQVLFAVSTNESRPVHTGALFEVEDTTLTLVAVDGYRLALRRETFIRKFGMNTFSFVVPGNALTEVERICADCDDEVIVTLGDRHVTFQVGQTLLVSRRLEGEFLNYRQTIPQNNPISLYVDTSMLQLSIDRASLIINDKLKSPLRCKFEDGSLAISSRTAIGSAFDRCPIAGDGQGLEIGFNNRYLMEAVKAAPAQEVRMELGTPTSPCLLLPKDGEPDNFLYMILPVRLKAGE